MPCNDWFWRWSYFAAILCHPRLILCDERQPGYLSFFLYKLGFINLSLWSFRVHNDCSKCGQTSRPFVEAKVQARRRGGGVLPYKGLMGTCGQPGYVFQDVCLKKGQGMRGRAVPPYPGIYRVPPRGTS